MGTLGMVTVPNGVITWASALGPQTKAYSLLLFKDHICLSPLGRLSVGTGLAGRPCRGGDGSPSGPFPRLQPLPHALTVFVGCQALLQLGWGPGGQNFHELILSRTCILQEIGRPR